jgi:hypothetical protein
MHNPTEETTISLVTGAFRAARVSPARSTTEGSFEHIAD